MADGGQAGWAGRDQTAGTDGNPSEASHASSDDAGAFESSDGPFDDGPEGPDDTEQ